MSYYTTKLSALLFLSLLLNAGCPLIEYSDSRLVVVNQSAANIYIKPQSDTIGPKPAAQIGFMLYKYSVKSRDSIKLKKPGKRGWEEYMDQFPDKKLHLYVFSEDTLKRYTTEQVIKGKKYRRRLDISLAELKANNWKVIYTD